MSLNEFIEDVANLRMKTRMKTRMKMRKKIRMKTRMKIRKRIVGIKRREGGVMRVVIGIVKEIIKRTIMQ